MRIKAGSIVEMLKKMDEAEEKAGIAFSTSSEEDLQIALEKMRELRQMLYSALAQEEEPQAVPYPFANPVIASVPWRDAPTATCGSSSNG